MVVAKREEVKVRVCFNFVVRENDFRMEQDIDARYGLVSTDMDKETTFNDLKILFGELFEVEESEFTLILRSKCCGPCKVVAWEKVLDVVARVTSKKPVVDIRCDLGEKGRLAVQDTFESVFSGEPGDEEREIFMEHLIERVPKAECWDFKKSIKRVGPARVELSYLDTKMGSPLLLLLPDLALSLIGSFVFDGFYNQAVSAKEDRLRRLVLLGVEGGLFGQDPVVYISRENGFDRLCMRALQWRFFEWCDLEDLKEGGGFRCNLEDDLRAHVTNRMPHDFRGLIWPYSRIARAQFYLQSIFRDLFESLVANFTQLHTLPEVWKTLVLYRENALFTDKTQGLYANEETVR
jgi:hypothetical protein